LTVEAPAEVEVSKEIEQKLATQLETDAAVPDPSPADQGEDAIEAEPTPKDPGEDDQETGTEETEAAVDADASEGQSAADDAMPQDSSSTSELDLSEVGQGELFEVATSEAVLEEIKEQKVVPKVEKVQVAANKTSLEDLVKVSDAEIANLAEQTVRIVVDEGLSVEVTVGEDGVDVLLEGNRSSLVGLKDTEAEIERSLRDAGHHLSSFTERDRDTGEQRRHENQRRSRFAKQVDPKSLRRVRRGTYVNTVA
jgi:hypothetical protein